MSWNGGEWCSGPVVTGEWCRGPMATGDWQYSGDLGLGFKRGGR